MTIVITSGCINQTINLGDKEKITTSTTTTRTTSVPANLCLTGSEPLYQRYEASAKEKDGECLKDEDCVIGGCSDETCHNEPVFSTCEVIPTPKNNFGCTACRCINTRCKWAK